jgi:hypothetical protein
MDILFRRIINGYLNRKEDYPISAAEYNLLPYIFMTQVYNNLDLSQNYAGVPLTLKARAAARNLTIAERMRKYASYRTTK